jgi:hypothetical protein
MAIIENLNLAEMQKQTSKKSYTFEEVLASPEMAHYHDAIRYLQVTPEREVFPRKFELSMQDIATDNVYALFRENPATPLNDVVSVVMDKLPKDLKPQMLLKLVQITIEKWEELTFEATHKKQSALEHA